VADAVFHRTAVHKKKKVCRLAFLVSCVMLTSLGGARIAVQPTASTATQHNAIMNGIMLCISRSNYHCLLFNQVHIGVQYNSVYSAEVPPG